MIEARGIYIGQIDCRAIEININSKVNAYRIPYSLKDYIETELNRGNTVDISYYINNRGQRIITKLTKRYYSFMEVKGIYMGQADSNSIEVIDTSNSNCKTYRLYNGLSEFVRDNLKEGVAIEFQCYRNHLEQLVITKIFYDGTIKVINAEGIYIGQMDPHSVEIKIDGEYAAFQTPFFMRDYIRNQLTTGVTVKLTYFLDDSNIAHLLKIQKKYYYFYYGDGIYVGQLDKNSAQIIDSNTSETTVYRLYDNLDKYVEEELSLGDFVEFQYYLNKDDQFVISYIESASV